MPWPFIGGALGFAVTVGGAWWLARNGAPLGLVFAAVSAGSVILGAVNSAGLIVSTRGERGQVTRSSVGTDDAQAAR
jgi:hypothetical protein